MFTKFAVAYRGIWHKELQEERFTEFAKKEWEKHLQPFSDTIITTVIEICEKKFEMPPTMAQFIGLCKNEANRHYVTKHEPIKKSSPETAAYYLNKMKEILNKGG
ncbi:Vir protein [Legionella sp. W05-934-2]|uniref:Vir protein n=1 Tax=Legionella sp. W05-934-2 TaxID=1198649 RepID=UPI0034620D9D